jgi:argininosuccinate synthase
MKVVLGYSGGLDTSVIVPWLRENYGADVICMAGDVGQHGGLRGMEAKALATGASAFFGEDLRQEFVEDFVWPTLKIGAPKSIRIRKRYLKENERKRASREAA